MEQPENHNTGVNQDTAGIALEKALRFIEYRPRSSREVEERLRRWGYAPSIRGSVVSHLESCGILDDREFARVFMGEMLRKGYGQQRIFNSLLAKRIDRELVDTVMLDYPHDDELERATKLAGAYASRFSGVESAAAIKKIVGYLTRRGYANGIAFEAARMTRSVDTQISPELE
ncbi:MAG TPA: regulatory protein RecX [Candidatus Anoxymicrobiaceae bacterium]|jgi:regulatory protein